MDVRTAAAAAGSGATLPTEARLVQAAYDTFVERGYSAASVQEISKRAGLTTGAIYSRFSGKEELFLAALSHRTDDQRRVWESYLSETVFAGGEPGSLGRVLLSVLPDPGVYRALQEFTFSDISDDSRAQLIRDRDEWHALLERLLDIHCRLSGITPAVPLADLVRPVAALIDGLVSMAALDATSDIEETFLFALNLLLRSNLHDTTVN